MDNLVFEESLSTEVESSEFINKRWIYVNDNNNGNYTSQIVLDSTPLSNSGGWINWSEGFLILPLVVCLTNATATDLPISTNLADYSWAFKSGFWQMIDSMTVEFNNQNVIQTTPFTNVFRSFKANTTFSQDDLKNHGASTGFYPDTAGSWAYSNDSVAVGAASAAVVQLNGRGTICGVSNNANGVLQTVSIGALTAATGGFGYVDNGVSGLIGNATANANLGGSAVGDAAGAQNPNCQTGSQYAINQGMKQRQDWVGYSAVGTSIASSSLNQAIINDATDCGTVYRAAKVQTAAGCISWVVYAKLRLKDLADYFDKLPMLKGSTIRFLINTNQAITNFTLTAGAITPATGLIATQPILAVNSVQIIGGRTNPIMLASAQYGCGSNPLTTISAATTFNLSVSIYQNTFSAQSAYSGSFAKGNTPCRLYAPVYTMNPLAESKYLSLLPTKRVLYKDIFQYQYSKIAAGEQFNFLVSNGINRIRSVLVVPFISNQNVGVNTNINALTTPVSATPAMPDGVMLTNFNILVSGINLFVSNELYDFEAFREQLMSSNQLNGNLTTGLTSGLISEDDFARGYRYYYGDCSRALPSEENVSRSVQIVGQNRSNCIIDLMVFVEFMKEMTIDISTGARVD